MKKIKLNQLQYKFWLDHQIKYPSTEYNDTNFTFEVKGKLDIAVLEESYRRILMEYPPLSSVIRVESGIPYFIQGDEPLQVPLLIKEVDEECSIDKLISAYVNVPFDLQKEYPCRFYVIRRNDKVFIIHVIHHVAIDGISFPLFFKRLEEIYHETRVNAYTSVSQIAQLECFDDIYESTYEAHREEDLAYWRQYIVDYPLSVSFPKNYAEEDYQPVLNFQVGNDIHQEVISFQEKGYATPFRLYAVVWALAVSKVTCVERLLVDHTINMRPKDNDKLLGAFVNNLPIRFDFNNGDLSFLDLLSSLNENMMEEKKHRYAFYHHILREEKKSGNKTSGGINVSISYKTGYGHAQLNLDGCDVKRYKHCDVQFSQGMVLMIEDDNDISCSLRYEPQISTSLVNTLSKVFQLILKQVLSNPYIKVKNLHVLSNEDQQKLIDNENKRLHSAVPAQTFFPRFQKIVHSFGDKVAVQYDNQKITYAELDKLSDYVAAHLRQLGFSQRRIGLISTKNAKMIVIILGILKSGNVYVPLDYNFPEDRLRFMIEDCNLSAILGLEELCTRISQIIQVYSFDELLEEVSISNISPTVSPSDDAYIIYTSGTTGKPKAIPIKHYMLNQAIDNTQDYLYLSSESRVSQFANICFDASLIEIFPVLCFGGTLVVLKDMETKDPLLFYSFLNDNKITFSYIPPVLLSNLPHKRIPSLKTILVAGDSTPQKTIEYWSQYHRILNAYGPTEGTIGTTYSVLQSKSLYNDIGIPERGVTCYVLDKYRNLLPENSLGELYIGGVKLTEGYINRPELNKEKFIRNPFLSSEDKDNNQYLYKTGDLVIRRDDGHLLFMGRADFQVKLNGYRIETGEIETKIGEFSNSIKDVIVLLCDIGSRKQLVAYVQVDNVNDFVEEQLRRHLRTKLPLYMLPAVFIPMEEFPCNASGKIDRRKLPNPNLYHRAEREVEKAVTPTEKKIAELWDKLLPIKDFGREDDLSMLGVDSLTVIQMSFSLSEMFGVNVKASDIYRNPTLKQLANFIDCEAYHGVSSEDVPLSPNQLSLWLQCAQSEKLKNANNLTCIFECPSHTLTKDFEDVFNKCVKLQDSLRMSFPLDNKRIPKIHISSYQKVEIIPVRMSSKELSSCLSEKTKTTFNLEEGPLYRVALYHVDGTKYYCSLTVHRMIADEVSLQIIQSLILNYLSGTYIDWSNYSESYLSFSQDYNSFVNTEDFANKVVYWKENLKGVEELALPQNNQENDSISHVSSCLKELPVHVCKETLAFCEKNHIELQEFYAATYLLLLSVMSRHSDFAIGIPCFERMSTRYKSTVGDFLNILPLCFREKYLSLNFKDYVDALHHYSLSAKENAIPLHELLRALRVESQNNNLDIIRTIFTFEEKKLFLNSIETDNIAFSLIFSILFDNDKYYGYLRYDKSCFSESDITLFLNSYVCLLENLLKNPDQPIQLGLLNLDGSLLDCFAYFPKDKVERKTDSDQSCSSPVTVAEVTTLSFVSSILNNNEIGINDNLFDYGINSMQIMELVAEMASVGIESSITAFYQKKNIKDILSDQESLLCYWGTDYDEQKPIMLIVCGHPYYKPGYNALTDVLKDKYSLLVIESYYESFFNYGVNSLEELLRSYLKMLKPIIKGRKFVGITGLCLGGEIGLQLACYLAKENIAHPKVYVIDGFASRGDTEEDIYIEAPGVSDEVNKKRNLVTNQLIHSFFFNKYDGETHVCLAKEFTARSYKDADDGHEDTLAYQKAYNTFKDNPDIWRTKMPECRIHFLNSDHWHIYLPEACLEVKKIMDESLDSEG